MLVWNTLGAVSHAQAREILAGEFKTLFGRAGTVPELQIAQAVSIGEGYYGQGVYKNRLTGETAVLNNWGAVQCRVRPPCPADCWEATDTHTDHTPYQACFRRYPTPGAGAAGFLVTLYKSRPGVLAAASRGDVDGVAREMRASKYYEAPLSTYTETLNANVDTVARALGEQRSAGGSAGGIKWPVYLGAVGLIVAGITYPSWRGYLKV